MDMSIKTNIAAIALADAFMDSIENGLV